MYYIRFNKQTNQVVYIGEQKPLNIEDDTYSIAEVKTLPEKYDYLTIDNVREETDTWTETIEEYNEETGEVIEKEVEKSRIYTTCGLVANFKPKLTSEQLEQVKALNKEKQYKELTSKLIRQKYSQSDVEAIVNNYLDNSENENEKEKYKNEFDELQNYRKECKAKARAKIYS